MSATTAGLDEAAVEAFLRAHPAFLADHPSLYRQLAPPARVHGEALSDHMAAMLRAERAHAAAMQDRAECVLAASRAAAGLAARVHEAVLALILAADKLDCILHEFPLLLAVDAVSLCIEAAARGAIAVPAGTVRSASLGRAVRFGPTDDVSALLHGEAAQIVRYEAVLLLPGAGPPALLALGSRDSAMLAPSRGTAALGFLARAVAAGLGRTEP